MAPRIWVDLDNTPHVPFFKPIIRELQSQGFEVVVSARNAYQVCALARKMGVSFVQVGRHYGKHKLMKVLGVLVRSMQFVPFIFRYRPQAGLSHGSRSQILICRLLRIPTVLIMDYEYAQSLPFARPTCIIRPNAIESLPSSINSSVTMCTYNGLKEDVYVPDFRPNEAVLQELQLDVNDVIIAVRPPAIEAHYYCCASEYLFKDFMNWIITLPKVHVILLPRNSRQEEKMLEENPSWFIGKRVSIPKTVVDGLNLLWHSDLVVSGGGTMNREAAALGVPVYSIFRGQIGAVDRMLVREGRLVLVETKDDFAKKIVVAKRQRPATSNCSGRTAIHEIVGHITALVYPTAQNH